MSPSASYFAATGVWRARRQSLFLISGQTALIATGILSVSLTGLTPSITGLSGVFGLAATLQAYLIVIIILSFIASITGAWAATRALMSFRKKDIALTVAIGGSYDHIHVRFVTELFLLLGIAIVAGNCFGLVFFIIIWVLFGLSGFSVPFSLQLLPLIIFNLAYIIVSYGVGAWILIRETNHTYVEILQADFLAPGRSILEKLFPDPRSITRKIALRGLSRSHVGIGIHSWLVFVTILLLCFLTLGNGVVKDTTLTYIDRSIGTDVWAIGTPIIVESVVESFRIFENQYPIPAESMLNVENAIPLSITDELSVHGFLDTRLVFISQVKEIPAGLRQGRTGNAWVVGLNPQHTVADWEADPRGITMGEVNENRFVIGDGLGNALFVDPLEETENVLIGEEIRVYNPENVNDSVKSPVKGVVYDTLGGGFTCYLPHRFLAESLSLSRIWRTQGNIIFFKPTSLTDLQSVQQLLETTGFVMSPLNPIRSANHQVLLSIWGVYILSSFPLAVGLIGSTINYFMSVVEHRKREIWVLKALGGSNRIISRAFIVEMLLLWTLVSIPAVLLGTVVPLSLLISNPVLSDPLAPLLTVFELVFLLVANLASIRWLILQRLKMFDNTLPLWY